MVLMVGGGLQVAGDAGLDADALAGDIAGQVLDVAAVVRDVRGLDHLVREEEGPVPDAVGVALGDGLPDGFRAVGFARVHGLADEVVVRVLVGLLVVLRRVAGLLSGQVEADDRQAFPRPSHGRARQLQGGRGVDVVLVGVLHDAQQAREIRRHALLEFAHAADDDAVMERQVRAGAHGGAPVVGLGAGPEALGHGAHRVRGGHAVADVQLGREAHLDVAHALGRVVLHELRATRSRFSGRRSTAQV